MIQEKNQKFSLKTIIDYLPLISLTVISMLASFALVKGVSGDRLKWMHYFMGIFFCQFAMLKFFNIKGFSEGFQKYDLIAKKLPQYGYIYPFIELFLGLSFLSFFSLVFTYSLTIFTSVVGAFGVVYSLKKGLNLRCACMGTVLNVPLSTVTLTEDVLMGIMALYMLWF